MSSHTAPAAPLPRISHRPAGHQIVVEADPALDCTAPAGTPPQPRTTPHRKKSAPMTHTAADTNHHSQLAAPVDVELGQLIMTAETLRKAARVLRDATNRHPDYADALADLLDNVADAHAFSKETGTPSIRRATKVAEQILERTS